MKQDYQRVDTPNPHLMRARQILAAHPEVRTLFGNTPSSALYIIGVVVFQILIAIALRHSPIWEILLVSYFLGAIANHAMWVMIHECTHNLVFRSTAANNVINIVANLPIVFPSAISFKKYHLWHHRYQGELYGDADLAAPAEAKLIGSSPWRKTLWLFAFFIFEGIVRPMRIKGVRLWCRWTILNTIVEFSFLGALAFFFGWKAVLYLALSTFFSIGLHPVGGRWIQEHYLFPGMGKPGQETFSYYGPINHVNFNIGYHNEHHDLMMVPWSNLPKLKKLAPEFYDTLDYHTSYTGLLLNFIFNRKVTLFSRVVRPDRSPMRPSEKSALAPSNDSLAENSIEPALS
jgi:sphingolipid delta-4 desaturase